MAKRATGDSGVVVKTLHHGTLHRYTVRTLAELCALLRAEHGGSSPALSYVDDDGDRVAVTGEADFREAVRFARTQGAKAVRLDLAWAPPVSAVSAPEADTRALGSAHGTLDAMQRRIASNIREISRLAALVDAGRRPGTSPSDAASESVQPEDAQKEAQVEQQQEQEEALEEMTVAEMPEPSAPPSEVGAEDNAAVASNREGVAAVCEDAAQRTAARCGELFAARAAETAAQCAGQAARSAAETRAAAALVNGTAGQVAAALAPGARRAETQRLAEDVVAICARLAQETAESCSAITLCIAEMVRRS